MFEIFSSIKAVYKSLAKVNNKNHVKNLNLSSDIYDSLYIPTPIGHNNPYDQNSPYQFTTLVLCWLNVNMLIYKHLMFIYRYLASI